MRASRVWFMTPRPPAQLACRGPRYRPSESSPIRRASGPSEGRDDLVVLRRARPRPAARARNEFIEKLALSTRTLLVGHAGEIERQHPVGAVGEAPNLSGVEP